MIFNHNAYIIKNMYFKKGIFDEIIDSTYIFTMKENLDRHKNIIYQLKI